MGNSAAKYEAKSGFLKMSLPAEKHVSLLHQKNFSFKEKCVLSILVLATEPELLSSHKYVG